MKITIKETADAILQAVYRSTQAGVAKPQRKVVAQVLLHTLFTDDKYTLDNIGSKFTAAVEFLKEQGKIEEFKKTVRGKKETYFKLVGDSFLDEPQSKDAD